MNNVYVNAAACVCALFGPGVEYFYGKETGVDDELIIIIETEFFLIFQCKAFLSLTSRFNVEVISRAKKKHRRDTAFEIFPQFGSKKEVKQLKL